jgi:hypothetical protein
MTDKSAEAALLADERPDQLVKFAAGVLYGALRRHATQVPEQAGAILSAFNAGRGRFTVTVTVVPEPPEIACGIAVDGGITVFETIKLEDRPAGALQ